MPKTKLGDKYSSKAPPIDWLWAAVLERKATYGLDLKQMANIAGVSYPMMRQYINRSPWSWPMAVRDKLCDHFGLDYKTFGPVEKGENK